MACNLCCTPSSSPSALLHCHSAVQWRVNLVIVVSLNLGIGSAEENCENWADYSPFTSGATGGLIGDKAIICGGYNSMQCYGVNKTSVSLVDCYMTS